MASRNESLQTAREYVQHGLAVLIVVATVGGALWSFHYVGVPGHMEDAKALLAVMSGLAGVVLGYYFGHVPAQSHVMQAQEQMNTAVEEKGKMQSRVDALDRELRTLQDRTVAGTALTKDDLAQLRNALNPPGALGLANP